ncbi:portal protein [Undibacterium sp. Ji42W]|uniref:portal protein n=1 Tax=Undibacterium sp. Ji42W TaxID=3413039 RepID=UPI003BF34938
MAMGTGLNITGANAPGITSVGGIMQMKSARQLRQEERQKATQFNNTPVIQGLASYVRKCWTVARTAKEQTVEQRMLRSLRQRRGEYDPDKLSIIGQQGGTTIYMMLTANKCRSAGAWIRDVLLTASNNKPWSVQPTTLPDIKPEQVQEIMGKAQGVIQQMQSSGQQMSDEDVRNMLLMMKDQAVSQERNVAQQAMHRMEYKMKDQLEEGGFITALSEFIDDLTTFPAAMLKGPIIRKKKRLAWGKDKKGQTAPVIQEELVTEWERLDPFNAYPAPDSANFDDGFFIERHRLQRSSLTELIGVDGYSDASIRLVLDEYGRGGLRDWINVDNAKASAEGKSTMAIGNNPSELIDALQFWGTVQGKMLLEHGMAEDQITDPLAEYPIEVWLIGNYVIKAVINKDPLGRKPYYKASYEQIPGSFWGNSVSDLCRDTQDACNATARALINNIAISSGPQVVYNVDRLPAGENITQLYPWKTWQVTSDPMNGTGPLMQFFQPDSRAQELLTVFERFSTMADEYTGIPRYMTGDSPSGGAGRTASGMSMLMGNAGKSIKQVISTIDIYVTCPLVSRLYDHNMQYAEDPDLKGDIRVVANGAAALAAQGQSDQRRNEFLQLATQNDVVKQVVGMEGIARIIREVAGTLGMNTDEIVPPIEVLRMQWAKDAQQAQQQQAAQAQTQGGGKGAPPQGGQASLPNAVSTGQQLQNGAPTVNNFTPMAK